MAGPSKRVLARALLDRHGVTFAEELGIDVAKGTPAPLFRLLVASILFSTRIAYDIAAEAARALFAQGWARARLRRRPRAVRRTRAAAVKRREARRTIPPARSG